MAATLPHEQASESQSISPYAKTGVPTPDSPSETTKENKEYITGLKLLAVIGSVTMVMFLLLLDQSVLGTAIPHITSQFHSISDVGWYTGVYPLTNAILQPLTGKLYTHFSSKYTYIAFLFVFEFGSLVCGLAPTSTALIVGRAIAGLGAAGLINGAMTIIAGCTPLQKRALYTGIMFGVSSLGIVMGPLIGGVLTEYATWRWCFYINLPIGGVAAAFLLMIAIPDLTVKEAISMKLVRKVLPELDLIGFALCTPAALMLLLALQFGGERSYSWSSAMVIGLFCGAALTAIIFAVWEWHMGARAMIPIPMLRQRIVWTSILYHTCLMSTVVVGSAYLPIYFQTVKGVGPARSGVDVLPAIIAQLLSAIIAGTAISKLGYYLPWAVFGGAFTAIGNGLVATFSPNTKTGIWIGFQIIQGLGRGSGVQVGSIAIQNALPPAQIPVALAVLVYLQNLGTAIFLVVATTAFTQSLVSDVEKYAPSVSPKDVLKAGGSADAVRSLVPTGSTELQGILKAYSESVNNVFFMLAGLAAVGFFLAWGTGWKSVKSKSEVKEKREEEMAVT